MNDELFKKIGTMLKNRREALGLSQQEIAEHVHVSKSAVSRWESGEVENMGRSKIQLLAEILKISPTSIVFGETEQEILVPYGTKKVPLIGEIAAGEPIFAFEDCRTYIEVDGSLQVDFCLKVKGDSMVSARIHDGDIVFIRRQSMVDDGEIAAVLIDDEVTLKRFYRTREGVILKPENPSYRPRFYTEKDFKDIRILGKAVMLQSKL